MTARLYDLNSTWTFPNSRQEVWDAIAGQDLPWPKWWPGCSYAEQPIETAAQPNPAEDPLLASSVTLKFRAPLGYALKVRYQPTSIRRLEEVKFDASLDLEGEGQVSLRSIDGGRTRMKILWQVRPTLSWMQFVGPVAAPAFTYAHERVMRNGERGLRRYLAKNVTKPK